MNTIRTFLSIGGLIVALALPAATLAQTTPSDQPGLGAPQRGGMMRAYDNLNLTPDQRQKIDALITQYRQAHPRGSTPDPNARKALRDQIFAILTPAQQAQLQANMAAARNGDFSGRMMARFAQLSLSDDQKNRIQSLISQFRASHPAGSPPDRQAMQQLRDQINAVLTPQQQQQLQQMRSQDQNRGQ
ncbi:MAG: hypothetical protein JOZ97_03075 [Candidatus Eremiobacteraeota bacterium]|nr:hypothetical protein [Candidatus Eremiobacteraeota bacterium]